MIYFYVRTQIREVYLFQDILTNVTLVSQSEGKKGELDF